MNSANEYAGRQNLPFTVFKRSVGHVMINVVFEMLQLGRVDCLYRAATLGSSRLVAVSTDAAANMMGRVHPRSLIDRTIALADLASVSIGTFIIYTCTTVNLIRSVRMEKHVKSGDYEMGAIDESSGVRGWGRQPEAILFVDVFSPGDLVQSIRAHLRQS